MYYINIPGQGKLARYTDAEKALVAAASERWRNSPELQAKYPDSGTPTGGYQTGSSKYLDAEITPAFEGYVANVNNNPYMAGYINAGGNEGTDRIAKEQGTAVGDRYTQKEIDALLAKYGNDWSQMSTAERKATGTYGVAQYGPESIVTETSDRTGGYTIPSYALLGKEGWSKQKSIDWLASPAGKEWTAQHSLNGGIGSVPTPQAGGGSSKPPPNNQTPTDYVFGQPGPDDGQRPPVPYPDTPYPPYKPPVIPPPIVDPPPYEPPPPKPPKPYEPPPMTNFPTSWGYNQPYGQGKGGDLMEIRGNQKPGGVGADPNGFNQRLSIGQHGFGNQPNFGYTFGYPGFMPPETRPPVQSIPAMSQAEYLALIRGQAYVPPVPNVTVPPSGGGVK